MDKIIERSIVPPSRRKLMLLKKIEEFRYDGYKQRSRKSFSVVLARPFHPKENLKFWKKIGLVMFNIPELIKYNKTEDLLLSVINVVIDMYGNIEVEEI